MQDIASNFGSNNRYSLQFSVDILNVGNLLNKNWGVYYTNGMQSYENFRLFTYTGQNAAGAAPIHPQCQQQRQFQEKLEMGRPELHSQHVGHSLRPAIELLTAAGLSLRTRNPIPYARRSSCCAIQKNGSFGEPFFFILLHMHKCPDSNLSGQKHAP